MTRMCLYHGQRCLMFYKHANGTVVLGCDNYHFVQSDGGWEAVGKIEWEKTVPVSEVTCLPDEANDKDL